MWKRIIRILGNFFYRMLSTKWYIDTGEISPNAGPYDVRM